MFAGGKRPSNYGLLSSKSMISLSHTNLISALDLLMSPKNFPSHPRNLFPKTSLPVSRHFRPILLTAGGPFLLTPGPGVVHTYIPDIYIYILVTKNAQNVKSSHWVYATAWGGDPWIRDPSRDPMGIIRTLAVSSLQQPLSVCSINMSFFILKKKLYKITAHK